MEMKPIVLIFFLFLPQISKSLQILQVVPGFSTSHVIFNYRVARSLTESGHNVTLLTVCSFLSLKASIKPPETVMEHRIINAKFDKETEEFILKTTEKVAFEPFQFWNFVKMIKFIGLQWTASCEQMLDNDILIQELGNE